MGNIRIGTSGWHYRHWLGPFYPQRLPSSEMLTFYTSCFDTVEINNSFYRLPERKTFAAWRKGTPKGFCFAVKASRYLTHRKKLLDPKPALRLFLDQSSELREKFGPILFQLPPRWKLNTDRLKEFLQALPRKKLCVVEFRDNSWHVEPVYELLRRYNVAFCVYDLAGFRSPEILTADFTYLRLHGPGGAYQGSYPNNVLRKWAKQIGAWQNMCETVFVYFNNDSQGHAVKNALALREMIT
jgi:uncharacterized protein YecE (DUF72 family)